MDKMEMRTKQVTIALYTRIVYTHEPNQEPNLVKLALTISP